MKRRVLTWIGGGIFSALSILSYLLLFQTFLFSSLIIDALNDSKLIPANFSVSGTLTGGLLSKSFGISNLDVLMNSEADTLLNASVLTLNEWDWDWDLKELILHEILMKDYTLNTHLLQRMDRSHPSSLPKSSTIIRQFTAERGKVIANIDSSLEAIIFPEFNSTIWLIDGHTHLKIHSAELMSPNLHVDTILISGSAGLDTDYQLEVSDFSMSSKQQSMLINAVIDSSSLSGTLVAEDINTSSLEMITVPAFLMDSKFDAELQYKLDGSDLSISGSGIITINAVNFPFSVHQFIKDETGEDIKLTLGTTLSHGDLSITRNQNGYVEGFSDIFRLDIGSILPNDDINISEPIGQISFSGVEGTYNIKPRFESFLFNGIRFDSLSSDLIYYPNRTVDVANGIITQSDNRLSISGLLSEEDINLVGNIALHDFSFLDNIGIKNEITGDLSSEFNMLGSMNNPRVSGVIHPIGLSYKKKLTLSGEGKVDLQINDRVLSGDFALVGNQGLLFGDSLESYNILVNLDDDKFAIEDLHLQGSNNLFSMSGGYNQDGLQVNKLNIIRENHQLKLSDTVFVEKSDEDQFLVPRSVLTFNNGGLSLSGKYSVSDGLAMHSAFELIDVADILDFFRFRQQFSGITSGSAEISGPLSDPIIDADFTLKNGMTLGYPSDSASINLHLTKFATVSNEINAYSAGGTLKLYGSLPWGYKVRGEQIRTTPQNFSIIADNYLLSDLKFTSIAGIPISGRATGSISIRGTPEETKMDAQLTLTQAAFDTLKFSKAYSEFNYEGNLLTFDTLSMVSNWGYGSGTGFMPIALDLIAEDRMSVSNRDMGLDFEFNLNEMPFLSSYISSIDGIQGDFIGSLGFSGPLSAPIRNGKIRGHNANLQISVLANPITDIHSEVTLVDNTLTLDHFSGKMQFSEGSNLNTQGIVGFLASNFGDLIGVNSTQTYAGDVEASGSIDLSSFFHPRFDIDVKGNEIYYRSTDGQIEAIANADLKFVGQDTLDATAVIPVLRAAYYSNFESEESYEDVVSKEDNNLFTYSLNTQFASDLLISNDQLEAEFEGELWLLDYGDGILRFTGTLTVQEGGKFYYLGNELELLSGEIIFNSVDFNPQINMTTIVEIDGERVDLTLGGDLLEPELVIENANTQLTQSDVLTYLTLNKKLVEVSLDQSAFDPVYTYGEIFLEKQLSQLGREYIGLDRVGVDLASDTTSVPRFQLGQRLSKNLMVTYEGALQPNDGSTDYDFGFEYQINQNVSVTSKINQNSEVELNARLKFTY